jgi:hypothetical protein
MPEACFQTFIRVHPWLSVVSFSAFCAPRSALILVLLALSAVNTMGIQQAWVTSYSNGAGSTNRAVALALDPSGNILVAGTSTASNTGFDYVLIKYSPAGVELWNRRFASPGSSFDEPRGLAVDELGSAFITGTSETRAYAADGTLLWSRPYAGRALAVDQGLFMSLDFRILRTLR